jgi:head-tail adaptor
MIEHLLNENIDIYRPEYTNDYGSLKETYNYLSTTNARIQPLSSSDIFKSGRKYSQPAYNVYTKSDTNINMKDRIKYNNLYFSVVEYNIYFNTYTHLVVEKVD